MQHKSHIKPNVFWVLGFFTILYILYFSPILFSTNIFGSDGVWAGFFSSHPFWTNFFYSGYPYFSDPIWQTLYPLRWLFSLLGSFNLYIISANFFASVFTYLYVYSLTRSSLGALISGIGFGLSGFMILRIPQAATLSHAAIWLPLMMFAIEMLRQKSSMLWVAIGGFSVAMSFLTGHPQLPVYSFYIMLFYVLALGTTASDGFSRYFLHYLMVMGLGTMLVAVQLLPAMELAHYSMRSTMTDYAFFAGLAVRGKQILQLVFPYLFGFCPWPFFRTSFMGGYDCLGMMGYMGFTLLLLAVFGTYARYKDRRVVFWATLAIVALILVFGVATPLPHLAYLLPVVNKFRDLSRNFFEFTFAISILAGFGLAALERKEVPQKIIYWLLVLAGFLMGLVVGAIFIKYPHLQQLALSSNGRQIPAFYINPTIIIPVCLFILSTGSLIIWSRVPQSYLYQGFLIVVVLIDLSSFGWFVFQEFGVKDGLKKTSYAIKYQTILEQSHQRLFPVVGVFADVMHPSLSKIHQIPNASGYDPLFMQQYFNFLGVNGDGVMTSIETVALNNKSLNLLGIKYLFVNLAVPYGETQILPALQKDQQRWHYVETIGNSQIYENSEVMPRVWLTHEVVSLNRELILNAVHTSSLPNGKIFDPYATALLKEKPSFKTGSQDPNDVAKIFSLDETKIAVQVKTKNPSFLVLSDIYYPGWKAYIDGKETHIYRTDYILRGVLVPSGDHFIIFKYTPRFFYLGLVISLIGLILLIWILLNEFFKRRKSQLTRNLRGLFLRGT